MKTKRVIVCSYDKAWKDNFNIIREELAAAHAKAVALFMYRGTFSPEREICR